jgi:hypothetical protein
VRARAALQARATARATARQTSRAGNAALARADPRWTVSPRARPGAKPRSSADLDRIRRGRGRGYPAARRPEGGGGVFRAACWCGPSPSSSRRRSAGRISYDAPSGPGWQRSPGGSTTPGRASRGARLRLGRSRAPWGGSTPLMPALCAPTAARSVRSGYLGKHGPRRACACCKRGPGMPTSHRGRQSCSSHATRPCTRLARCGRRPSWHRSLKVEVGTDFRPVFQAVEELRPQGRPVRVRHGRPGAGTGGSSTRVRNDLGVGRAVLVGAVRLGKENPDQGIIVQTRHD